ncbi:hypothetical protein Gasu2_26760 [Galdieria sulphuraria]|nr:hypothetical protein Gasu2_26760 [Galdieria sulphuraria]
MSWVEEEEWKYFRCGGRHILFEPMGKQPLSKGLLLRVRRQDARQFTSLEVFIICQKLTMFPFPPGFFVSSRDLFTVNLWKKSALYYSCMYRLVPAPISQYKYRYYRSNLKNFQSEDSLVYTPEDILSFQHDRIRRALVSLIRQKSKYLQLLHPHQPEPISSTILETKLDILVHIICKEAILLSRLRMIQQLDILDYEGAKLALEALETLKDSDLEKLEKKIYGKSFTPGWLKEELLYLNSFHDMIFDSDEEETRMHWCLTGDIQKLERSFLQGLSCLHSLESGELERILGDFLYSTITKDCSLLISFVQVSENSNCYLSDMWKPIYIEQRMYYYSISVIDLEPKSLKKLKIWLENDQFLFQFP